METYKHKSADTQSSEYTHVSRFTSVNNITSLVKPKKERKPKQKCAETSYMLSNSGISYRLKQF